MLVFPDDKMLNFWIHSLKKHPEVFKGIVGYLPKTNQQWVSRMDDIFSRAEYKYDHVYSHVEINDVAADIFYNIIKLHAEIDGNKRSALICIYLFFTTNIMMKSPEIFVFSKKGTFKVYKMAKRIAKSKGNKYESTHKKRLSQEFFKLLN